MSFEIPADVKAELEAHPELLGAQLRDEAMERVYDAADPKVRADAHRAVKEVARVKPTFTSDDVWAEMIFRPREPRMLGPVMKAEAAAGTMEKTDQTVLSKLPQNHRRDIRVWRSLVLGRDPSHEVRNTEDDPPFDWRTQGLIAPSTAGFVCYACRCSVDHNMQGDHAEGCEYLVWATVYDAS